MYHRLSKPLKSNSFFVFGARGVGKTTLLNNLFKDTDGVYWVNLLDNQIYTDSLKNPNWLEEKINALTKKPDWVVIDEVQRSPQTLNTVHKLIEEKKIKFALTGSSARKLKKVSANLLAGRALMNYLHPLTCYELADQFDLNHTLNFGSLPYIVNSSDELTKKEILKSYITTYLREEIKEEQIIRQLDPFVRFLDVAAQHNGKIINAAKIGRESQTDTSAIIRYFEILTDTLLGFFLEPYHTSARKIQSAKAKFYFFDIGVKRALENSLDSKVVPQTYAYGNNFEHFFILECIRLNDYYRKNYKFYYSNTKDGVEIDLIVQFSDKKIWSIEIKSSSKINAADFGYNLKLSDDLKAKKFIVACLEKESRITAEKIEIHHWKTVLHMLFSSV